MYNLCPAKWLTMVDFIESGSSQFSFYFVFSDTLSAIKLMLLAERGTSNWLVSNRFCQLHIKEVSQASQ